MALQLINIIFCVLSYMYLSEKFAEHENGKIVIFLVLFPTFMGGVYVFFANRVFYKWIIHKDT